ncbi:transposase [Nitrospirillum amazonense]|uniref:Transposase n=1 Tax=Nitrospirillum amazonense TaxID=28077 RepID=A0A560KII0_9PROT|nr:IS110 family transposase [Nitrospirillum amazonense]TWB83075.1 transposase [Nitrospirillum amazonense]
MTTTYLVAIDLAKRHFQVCATDFSGKVLFNRAFSRQKLMVFLSGQPRCIVAMEACSTSHYWGRLAEGAGHEVRLIPPIYVKPFVKRQKNDAADAEAISEAARRPNLHFVAVKSAEHQARAVTFRTHQCFVRQRTQLINALRGHLAEFGIVAPVGATNVTRLEEAIGAEDDDLPPVVREMAGFYLEQIKALTVRIDGLVQRLQSASRTDAFLRRLCTLPGVGPVTAGALAAFAPDLRTFSDGRNFAAWLGLVPKQLSSGGKSRLGGMSRMGQDDIRRLLIIGAMSRIRWICRRGATPDNWLGRLLLRKPRMVAAVALANKMARTLWAMVIRQQDYRTA